LDGGFGFAYRKDLSMNRRLFLQLPTLLPFLNIGSGSGSQPHHFHYDFVIGTSLDLTVCSPSSAVADGACQTIRDEIGRLATILDTRNPASEISRFEAADSQGQPSLELTDVLHAYDDWERRTDGVLSIRPEDRDGRRNVDALGKAYILDRAAAAALKAWPSVDALLLDIGGDVVTWGNSSEIAIADPNAWFDNAPPIATIGVRNVAVATSGTYARGAHLTNARTGKSPRHSVAATVIAPDAVTANALATTLCVTSASDGLQLVESTLGAEALRIESGVLQRTSGFAVLERPSIARLPAASQWPAGYKVTVGLPLTATRSAKRPYVGVWVEDPSGKVIRGLALWGTKSKYQPDLSTLWNRVHGNMEAFRSVTRATRPAGKYDLVWDGLDNDKKPVPPGPYVITVETNQERGTYAKQSGTITIGDSPTSITLPATANFDAVVVKYGPA